MSPLSAPGRVALCGPLLLLTEVLLCLGIATRPHPLRWLYSLPIIAISIYGILSTTSGRSTDDVAFGCAFGCAIGMALDFLVLTDVQNDLVKFDRPKYLTSPERVKEEVRAKKGRIQHSGWGERLLWAIKLRWSPRGIGWSHEVPIDAGNLHTFLGLSPPKEGNRAWEKTYFVLSRLQHILVSAFILDISTYIGRRNPYRAGNTVPVPDSGTLASYLWAFWPLQYVIFGSLMQQIAHSGLSLVFVCLGLSEIEDWPPSFGPWKEAYTVRRFWA